MIPFTSFTEKICSFERHVRDRHNTNAHLAVGLSRKKEKEMPEHDAAIQLNLAWSRLVVKLRNNNNIRLLFKIRHSVLTPAHTSHKRDKHRLFC